MSLKARHKERVFTLLTKTPRKLIFAWGICRLRKMIRIISLSRSPTIFLAVTREWAGYSEVRTKRGLAYSVGSELSTGVYDQGMWLLWAETKLPSTKEVLGQLVANIERISSELVSDEELDESKEAYVNSWIFDFSSASKIVSRLMRLEYDGLPKDFFSAGPEKYSRSRRMTS